MERARARARGGEEGSASGCCIALCGPVLRHQPCHSTGRRGWERSPPSPPLVRSVTLVPLLDGSHSWMDRGAKHGQSRFTNDKNSTERTQTDLCPPCASSGADLPSVPLFTIRPNGARRCSGGCQALQQQGWHRHADQLPATQALSCQHPDQWQDRGDRNAWAGLWRAAQGCCEPV